MRFAVIAVLLFLLPMVDAASYGNVTLSATGSDTNVTFAGALVDADQADVESTYVTLWNASTTAYSTTVLCDVLNFSTPNTTTDSAAFPQATASTTNTRTITNGLSNACNGTISATTAGMTPSSPRITYPNGSSEYPSYSYDAVAGTVMFSEVEIPPGVSTIELDTAGPSIVIAGPGNTSSDLDGTLNFTFTPTDDNLLSCSLYIENQLWTTANSTNGTLSNITVTMVDNSPGGAPLSWFISCVDTAGNTANSSTYLLTTIQTGITAPAAGPVGGGGGGATTTPAAVPIDTTPLAVEPEQATTLNSFFKSDMAKFVLLALFIVGMIWVFGGFKR